MPLPVAPSTPKSLLLSPEFGVGSVRVPERSVTGNLTDPRQQPVLRSIPYSLRL